MGHRQWFTEIKITSIAESGASASPKAAAKVSAKAAPSAAASGDRDGWIASDRYRLRKLRSVFD